MPESAVSIGWRRGPHDQRPTGTAWLVRAGVDAQVRARHQRPDAIDQSLHAAYADPPAVDAQVQARHGAAVPISVAVQERLSLLAHRDAGLSARHEVAVGHQDRANRGRWLSKAHTDANQPTVWIGRIDLGDLRRPLVPPPAYVPPPSPIIDYPEWIGTDPFGLPLIDDYTIIPTPAWTGRMLDGWGLSRWRVAVPLESRLRVRWTPLVVIYGGAGPGTGTGGGWEQETGRVVIPRRSYYVRTHALSVVRLPDRTPLPVRGLTLTCDASQWAWTLSMDLLGAGAPALIEPAGADPVQIEVSINGATWVCIAENWGASERWGALQVTTVKGRSLTALLSATYSRPRSYAETSALTMAQLAEQELPSGGGWDLDWEPADWAVPAGAWSYQELSPIQALARLAGSAGALIAPGRADLSLAVRPVHRVLPWDLTDGMEDLLVPAAAILEVGKVYRWPTQANAVHLYGSEQGGIQAQVYRTGTAGDEAAADRLDPLITHVDAARAQGGRILAGLHRPTGLTSITLPVDARADFAVPELGDLVRVDLSGHPAAPVTSITVSVQSQGDAMRVRQTLGLGETRNEYQRLLELMPREPRILAQVTATGSGTVRVETLSGGTLQVRGTASVGAWVWVRAGRVEDGAPTLNGYAVAV